MRILYRDPETEALTITDITNTQYDADEGILTFFGDNDISISVGRKESDDLTRALFMEGRLDLTGYDCDYYDWPDDDDDDEDDDDIEFVLGPDFLADL